MLRIFVFDEPYTVKLRLEGRLTAETVPLLTQHWAEVRSRLKGRKAILDLGDVVEVDETGRRTLAWLSGSGATLGYAHPNVRPLVEDLACDEPGISQFSARLWKRLHVAQCYERWDSRLCQLCRLICALLPPAWRHLASWVGNWELDVIAEDEPFSQKMENMYLQDLAHSIEIVLRDKNQVRPAVERTGNGPPQKTASGSAGRAAAGVLRIGNAVGAAITSHRILGPAEARIMFIVACLLLPLTVVAILWPRLVAVPIAVLGGWLALSLLVRAYRLRARRK